MPVFTCPGTAGGVKPGDGGAPPQLTPATAVSVLYRNHFQQGPFANAHLKFPLNNKPAPLAWFFDLDNTFTLYLKGAGDQRFDTRYLEKISPSLEIPVFGNLTITPRVDFYLFKNKVEGSRFRSANPSVSVTYRFKWHDGLRWRKALWYANPAPDVRSASPPF